MNFNLEKHTDHKRGVFEVIVCINKCIDIKSVKVYSNQKLKYFCHCLSACVLCWWTGRSLFSEGEKPSRSGRYRVVHLERFGLLLSEEGQHDDPTQNLPTASVALNQAQPMSSGPYVNQPITVLKATATQVGWILPWWKSVWIECLQGGS